VSYVDEGLGWRPRGLSLGQNEAEAPAFSLEKTLTAHSALLEKLQKDTEKTLLFRKIATGAAIAGALFAAIRLTDIWLAVKARRRVESGR
jgi:hypothetical protein